VIAGILAICVRVGWGGPARALEGATIKLVLDSRSRPPRDLLISVTDRCNFRCTCCMPNLDALDDETFAA
jgi:hypothetical protein